MPISKPCIFLIALSFVALPYYCGFPPPSLPVSLEKLLVNRYPGYRISDCNDIPKNYLEDDDATSCLKTPGIAYADYDGNG